MKFLADENVDRGIVNALRTAGHDVIYVLEYAKSITDEEVIRMAQDEGAIILTLDKDFGEMVFLRSAPSCGVILLRLAGLDASRKAEIVLQAVAKHQHKLPGSFVVITKNLVRIRHLF